MSDSHAAIPNRPWLSAAVFGVLLAMVIAAWLAGVQSPQRIGRAESSGDYSQEALRAAIKPQAVDARRLEIEALGRRLPGDPGHAAAARLIADKFRAHGLEVIERRGNVVTPVVESARITAAVGGSLPGIEIHPFWPNNFQPMATPPGGLRGRLVFLDEETVRRSPGFEGAIGVVDINNPPEDFGLDWIRYAQLGIEALILVSRDSRVDWMPLWQDNRMVSSLPLNFVRVFATGPLWDHLGQEVVLDVRQSYREVGNTSVVGILRAEHPAAEAMVFTAGYGSYGLLPTLANSAQQAWFPATLLALADGFVPYRSSLTRDVIFVADGSEMVGSSGEAAVISAIGPQGRETGTLEWVGTRLRNHEEMLARVGRCAALLGGKDFLLDPGGTRVAVGTLDGTDRGFLESQLRFVLQTEVFELSESVLAAKLPLDRAASRVTSGPLFEEFQSRLAIFNRFQALSSAGMDRLLDRRVEPELLERIRERLSRRFHELEEFHRSGLEQARADKAIHEASSNYQGIFVLAPRLLPGGAEAGKQAFDLVSGEFPAFGVTNRQIPLLNAMASNLAQRREFQEALDVGTLRSDGNLRILPSLARLYLPTRMWTNFGHPAFAAVNADRLASYIALAVPPHQHDITTASGMEDSLAFLGSLALGIGNGEMPIRSHDNPKVRSFSGSVLASNVGQSVVPNYALPGAFVGLQSTDAMLRDSPAVAVRPIMVTDAYGRYELEHTPAEIFLQNDNTYSPQAFWFGADGTISWAKDRTGSKIFKSEDLPATRPEMSDLNLVVFRADPTTYLDLNDPQSMQSFAAVSPLRRQGLSPFQSSALFSNLDTATTFLPPDGFFFTTLRSGAPDNPLVQTIRGFLLGPSDGPDSPRTGDIAGDGYLVADTPLFPSIALPLADSMLRLNLERADLQERRHMLNPSIARLIDRSEELLGAAKAPGISQAEAILFARESAAYSLLVHPILRSNISGAVVSILWYLGLLVPFVFFAEKLVFGFADIRKQLAAQAVIFLVVFGLLRLMHPAFDMIRSSFMILLGFVILLISGGVTVLFAGKFRENLQALEAMRGKAAGASVNTMGIVATAFMLGLNNMHRRKVRTGLTCGTLVLITFAMIAFTSVRSDLVETVVPLGPAPYQGLLVKKDEGSYVSGAEAFALMSRYRSRFPVSTRSFFLGSLNTFTREVRNPSLEARVASSEGPARSARFQSILQFDANEPLRGRIALLTRQFWFSGKDKSSAAPPVIVSDRIAKELGVEPSRIDAEGPVEVSINGGMFRIAGIFDSNSLNALRDLDGQSLLPPDVLGMVNPRNDPQGAPLNSPEAPRILAEDVVLMPLGPLGITVPHSSARTASVVIGLSELGYRDARAVIFEYFEQTGASAFFGLDGVASRGMRIQASSLQGLPDMIMPLIIAALTVLNTMKGSVYERRDEIAVYNAVGIAPRYIFFMFFAEAFVYSVIGAVLGYLLSQGTGFVLTALDMTGGLKMTFAGPETIFASLAVVAAVFISTLFPARTAMQIAAPSDDAGWSMPDPEGDEFSFALPFTFNPHDRLAVLAFFHRFLVDHGEGGSGRFFAGPPAMECTGGEEDPIPQVTSTIWLKPYDLGVSQVMTISLPLDPETREFVARVTIERLTGTRESWIRVNRSLMVQVREQFLHWRAVTPAQKEEFFESANRLLEAGTAGPVNPEEVHV